MVPLEMWKVYSEFANVAPIATFPTISPKLFEISNEPLLNFIVTVCGLIAAELIMKFEITAEPAFENLGLLSNAIGLTLMIDHSSVPTKFLCEVNVWNGVKTYFSPSAKTDSSLCGSTRKEILSELNVIPSFA